MNEQKIAFIICYNNELALYECLKYISFLKVPEGMEIDTITVSDASSMTEGYNTAMNSSDAKYKVYLHQDVFILYQDFIQDMVNTFRNNPEFGMLGVLGGDEIPSNANFWCNWNRGCVYANNTREQFDLVYSNTTNVIPVSAIDGLIMMTQYDIPWREDIFDSFDFYDASQSLEFHKAGYKVGIPYQKETWCMHDCGHSKLNKYDKYRKIFCKEYANMGFTYEELSNQILDIEKMQEVKNDIPRIEKLVEDKDIANLSNVLNCTLKKTHRNTQLCIFDILYQILFEENSKRIEKGFFYGCDNIESLRKKYYLFRFLLMRIYYGKPLDDFVEVCLEFASQEDKGLCAANVIAKCITLTEQESSEVLRKYLFLVEGRLSVR